MKKNRIFVILAASLLVLLAAFVLNSFKGRDGAAPKKSIPATSFNLPIYFEPNQGQADPSFRFLSRGHRYALAFAKNDLTLLYTNKEETTPVKMSFAGAGSPVLSGKEKQQGISNYFKGNDSSGWITGIPHYARLEYKEVYPGIGLVFYGKGQELEYDFIVNPGADPKRIEIAFDGSAKPKIDQKGNLLLNGENVFFRAPFIYQVKDGKKEEVKGNFILKPHNKVAFQVASFDRTRELVIDPVLVFSTYLGGGSNDEGRDIAVDSNGNILVTGITVSTNFPLNNQIRSTASGSEAFVTKFNPNGTAPLIYSTFLGGGQNDEGRGIAVDSAGNAFITGSTLSSDFPTLNPISGSSFRTGDAFITKLNGNGVLQFSSFLGGTDIDEGNDVALDSSGNVFITGLTRSTDFPVTAGAAQGSIGGAPDAFVTKLVPSSSTYVLGFSTFLGGFGSETGFGIATDSSGNAYVTGGTGSINFPVSARVFQTALKGGKDVFVTKYNSSGTRQYSTLLGGTGDDNGNAIAVDSADNAYITGQTSSLVDFPVLNAFQSESSGAPDAFVSKLNPSGSALSYSSFIGGSVEDGGNNIKVDGTGIAYVVGSTSSTDFHLVHQLSSAPNVPNAFLVQVAKDGKSLLSSSEIGGASADSGFGIAIDSSGTAYITGKTISTDFIVNGTSFNTSANGGEDAFVSKITLDNPPTAPELVSPANGAVVNTPSFTFKWNASTDPDGDPVTYKIAICAGDASAHCTPETVPDSAGLQKNKFYAGAFFSVLFFGIVLSGIKGRKKFLLALMFLFVILLFTLSCSGGGGETPSTTKSFIKTGLINGTTYGWKVIATDNKNASTSSEVRTFNTQF